MMLLCLLLSPFFIPSSAENEVLLNKVQLQRTIFVATAASNHSVQISCADVKSIQVMSKDMEYFCSGKASYGSQQEMNIFFTGRNSLMEAEHVPLWNITLTCNSTVVWCIFGFLGNEYSKVNMMIIEHRNSSVPRCGMFNLTFVYVRSYAEDKHSSTSTAADIQRSPTTTTPGSCLDGFDEYKGDFYSAVFGLTLLGAVVLVLILYIFLKACCCQKTSSKIEARKDEENYEDIATIYEPPTADNRGSHFINNFYEIPKRRFMSYKSSDGSSVETPSRIEAVFDNRRESRETESTSISERSPVPSFIENKVYLQSSRKGTFGTEEESPSLKI